MEAAAVSYVYEDCEGGPCACPGEERCLRLIADGGTCVKYGRECGSNALHCLKWGYECDFRYDDRD